MGNVLINATDYREARIKADAMEQEIGWWLLYVGLVENSDGWLFRPTKQIGRRK